jgi:hypothetical protein
MDNTEAAAIASIAGVRLPHEWMFSELRVVVSITHRAINDKKSRNLDAEPFLYRAAKKDSNALDSLNEYLKAFGISKKDLVKKCRPRDKYD